MSERPENGDSEANIGLLNGPDIRTGFVKRIKQDDYKPVVYAAVDGMAMFEGCIVLDTVENMETLTKGLQEHADTNDLQALGVSITGARFRWPGAKVPFTIAANLPNQTRVTKAIEHWHAKTKLKFVDRKPTDRNFITFRPADGCSSMVGMRGGQQFINLASACTLGNVIHEIGHAIGLWHEQSREDRDRFIRINFQNIDPNAIHNFNQHISDGDDLGAYDFGSIMHYPRTAFSKNGKPTIEPVGNQSIGQRSGLSANDVKSVHTMYGL
jgi:hypothetical protein